MRLSLLLIGVSLATSLLQADAMEGHELFDEAKCMACHNNEDFNPKTGKAKNYNLLVGKIDACQIENSAEWFDEDVQSVAEFMNEKFYHFKTK